MFEAVIAICAAASAATVTDAPCRDSLLPGYEAPSAAECEAALAARPPDVAEARCAPVGEALAVVEVAPGVFVHEGRVALPSPDNRGDVSNLGFVIGAEAVAVIDSGAARWVGEALWRAIRARSDKPVRHVALTHMHPDHVFGASVFADAGAEIIGHLNLPRALGDREANYAESLERLIGTAHFLGTTAAKVDRLVEGEMRIDLGDRRLTLRAWPTAHTLADVTVLDEATGTLFAGDLIFHRHAPALDGKLLGWRAVLAEMRAMDVARVAPGHGDAVLDWPAGAADQARYLDVLASDTRAAIAAGARLGDAVEVIADSEREAWELFEEYNPRNATVAFTELEWE